MSSGNKLLSFLRRVILFLNASFTNKVSIFVFNFSKRFLLAMVFLSESPALYLAIKIFLTDSSSLDSEILLFLYAALIFFIPTATLLETNMMSFPA